MLSFSVIISFPVVCPLVTELYFGKFKKWQNVIILWFNLYPCCDEIYKNVITSWKGELSFHKRAKICDPYIIIRTKHIRAKIGIEIMWRSYEIWLVLLQQCNLKERFINIRWNNAVIRTYQKDWHEPWGFMSEHGGEI